MVDVQKEKINNIVDPIKNRALSKVCINLETENVITFSSNQTVKVFKLPEE